MQLLSYKNDVFLNFLAPSKASTTHTTKEEEGGRKQVKQHPKIEIKKKWKEKYYQLERRRKNS